MGPGLTIALTRNAFEGERDRAQTRGGAAPKKDVKDVALLGGAGFAKSLDAQGPNTAKTEAAPAKLIAGACKATQDVQFLLR